VLWVFIRKILLALSKEILKAFYSLAPTTRLHPVQRNNQNVYSNQYYVCNDFGEYTYYHRLQTIPSMIESLLRLSSYDRTILLRIFFGGDRCIVAFIDYILVYLWISRSQMTSHFLEEG